MSNVEKFKKIISGSKEYSFNGTVLTIKGYYTGDTVKLDLRCIDEEMLEEIIVKDDDFEEDDEYDDEDDEE